MSPLAEILLRGGIHVSGSDVKASDVTAQLQAVGLEFHVGHDAAHVGDVDVVVRSSAVRTSNVEVAEARRCGIPVILRGELLAELMRGRSGIETWRCVWLATTWPRRVASATSSGCWAARVPMAKNVAKTWNRSSRSSSRGR